MNLTTGEPFQDGAHILYVNGEYRGNDALGLLMHDFNCTKAEDMHFELMAERTKYLKENPEGVSIMCKAMEDMRNEAEIHGMDMFAALIRKLTELGRFEDIPRVADNAAYRDQLIADFAIG